MTDSEFIDYISTYIIDAECNVPNLFRSLLDKNAVRIRHFKVGTKKPLTVVFFKKDDTIVYGSCAGLLSKKDARIVAFNRLFTFLVSSQLKEKVGVEVVNGPLLSKRSFPGNRNLELCEYGIVNISIIDKIKLLYRMRKLSEITDGLSRILNTYGKLSEVWVRTLIDAKVNSFLGKECKYEMEKNAK